MERIVEVSDRINIYYDSSDFSQVINAYEDYIKNETLCVNITSKELNTAKINVNDFEIKVVIEKVNS